MSFPDRYPASRPIEVEGGIRARSSRGAIGRTWWSRRFLDVLESFALGTRLARGRNYARRGQVLDLTVAAGTVSATVQGSRPAPYRVKIKIAPFPDRTWRRVERDLAARASYSAALLAGEMPYDIEDVFAAAGLALFPTALSDLRLSCSCPDGEVPCKHLAAVFYLLAERFDAEPFQIMAWRGRDRAALLGRLRELRDGCDADAATSGTTAPGRGGAVVATVATPAGAVAAPAPDVPPAGAAALPAVPSAGVEATLAGWGAADAAPPERYFLPPVPLPRRPATLAADVDLLLRQLPAPPDSLGGAGLAERLRRAYELFGRLDPD